MATRILVIHYTPPGVIGGVEHILHQHIHLLQQRGVRVQIAAGRPGGADVRAHVIPEIDAASTSNVLIEADLAVGVVDQQFHRARQAILPKLQALAADADFIIVHNAFTLHFNLPLTAALWELAATRPSGSVIAWCHDLAWTNPLYAPAMHDGYPWDLLRSPAPNTKYVTVSRERARELREIWGRQDSEIDVVPNGIDAATFMRLSAPTRRLVDQYRLFDRDCVLLLPVRITRRKNIELGIRAVEALKDGGLDVCFLISGPTAPHHPGRSRTYLAELQDLREQLGVRDEVVFLADELGENLEDQTVAELYAVADALLFPSAHEGFGLPILEAGLARLPAVVTDIPIFAEVGGDDVWRVDLAATAETIADRIRTALNENCARLYRRILHEFRWEVIVDRKIIPLLNAEYSKVAP